MDRYFYSIESDESGNKVVHLFGNIYDSEDGTETHYRIGEWKFFIVPVAEIIRMIKTEALEEHLYDKGYYSLENITEEQAVEFRDTYFDGSSGTELYIGDITEDTPYGDYWFEWREQDE